MNGHRGVSGNDFFNEPAHGFQAQGQRRDVQKQPVVAFGNVTGKLIGLHRCAHGHHLVRIDVAKRRLSEIRINGLAHAGHARCAPHKHHALNIGGAFFGVL